MQRPVGVIKKCKKVSITEVSGSRREGAQGKQEVGEAMLFFHLLVY